MTDPVTWPALRFTVPGDPVAKGRPRGVAVGGSRVRQVTPARTRSYEAMVCAYAATAALEQGTDAGPWKVGRRVALRVEIDAVFRRPGTRFRVRDDDGHRHPRVSRPDTDNVVKAILDGIDKAGVWEDDAQVAEVIARKWHGRILDRRARMSEAPHVSVVVSVIPTFDG